MKTEAVLKENAGKEAADKPRMYFIDNLRGMMIILVVMIHINVTYSGIGGWYYVEQDSGRLDIFSKVFCGLFGMFLQAFFMGILFFIAGYFVPGSFDRKGAIRFIKERFIRLGIPAAVYMFVINPFILYFLLGIYRKGSAETALSVSYIRYIQSGDFLGGSGPMWFALALLVFSILYSAARLAGARPGSSRKTVISSKMILGLILLVTGVTFLVRLYFPFGTDIFNMQLCFFTQYIVLFIAGITAYRKRFFESLTYRFGTRWMKYGVSLGMLFWIIIIVAGGALSGNEKALFGGLKWQSAGYSFWESLICASMSLGLLAVFREKYNKHNRLSKFISDNAFGVYAFHPPLLIFISISLRNVTVYPVLKILLVGIITLPVVFIFSYLIRKVPGVGKLYS